MPPTDWSRVPIPESYSDLYNNYGDPHSIRFVQDYTTVVEHQLGTDPNHMVKMQVHIAIAKPLHELWVDLKASGLISLMTSFEGCYVLRNIRGERALSLHAWGLALDFNSLRYPLGSLIRFPQPVVNLWKKHGFFYGGDFIHRKDPMHFQRTPPDKHTI